MSVQMMSLVWNADSGELKGSKRLLMLAIADSANDDGRCWPGMAKLSEKTGVSRRQVMRLVQQLEEAGYISVDRADNRSNHYCINVTKLVETGSDKLSPPGQMDSDKLSPGSDTGDTRVVTPMSPGGDIAMSPEPSITINRTVKNQRGGAARPHPEAPLAETADERELVSHPATAVWLEAGFDWPGFSVLPEITGRLGREPDQDTLIRARRLWQASGYRSRNVLGILDWYDELRADPAWMPGPPSRNGQKRPSAKERQPTIAGSW